MNWIYCDFFASASTNFVESMCDELCVGSKVSQHTHARGVHTNLVLENDDQNLPTLSEGPHSGAPLHIRKCVKNKFKRKTETNFSKTKFCCVYGVCVCAVSARELRLCSMKLILSCFRFLCDLSYPIECVTWLHTCWLSSVAKIPRPSPISRKS